MVYVSKHHAFYTNIMPQDITEKIAEIVAEYQRAGVNWSAWAKAEGFKYQVVRDVITGRTKCKRGESFRVAVALGAIPPPPPSLRHLSEPTPTEHAA